MQLVFNSVENIVDILISHCARNAHSLTNYMLKMIIGAPQAWGESAEQPSSN